MNALRPSRPGLHLTLALGLALSGCRSMPPAQPSPLAAAAAERLAQTAPAQYRLLTTVTFAFFGRSIAGLGLVDVDTATRSFSVVGMNHMGAKLIELVQTNGVVAAASGLPVFMERGDLAGTVAADISRIYFDLAPSPAATAYPAREGTWFVQAEEDGVMERRLDADGRLLEKRFRSGWRTAWSARYSEYREEGGRWYPGRIDFRNRRQHYTITVRLRSVTHEGP